MAQPTTYFLVLRRTGAQRVVLVVEAESEDAVHSTLARDPWSGTHLRVDTIDRWTNRLDGRRA